MKNNAKLHFSTDRAEKRIEMIGWLFSLGLGCWWFGATAKARWLGMILIGARVATHHRAKFENGSLEVLI